MVYGWSNTPAKIEHALTDADPTTAAAFSVYRKTMPSIENYRRVLYAVRRKESGMTCGRMRPAQATDIASRAIAGCRAPFCITLPRRFIALQELMP